MPSRQFVSSLPPLLKSRSQPVPLSSSARQVAPRERAVEDATASVGPTLHPFIYSRKQLVSFFVFRSISHPSMNAKLPSRQFVIAAPPPFVSTSQPILLSSSGARQSRPRARSEEDVVACVGFREHVLGRGNPLGQLMSFLASLSRSTLHPCTSLKLFLLGSL